MKFAIFANGIKKLFKILLTIFIEAIQKSVSNNNILNMATGNNWNTAAINGLILSSVTIISSLLQSAFKFEGLLSIVLWMAKFGGCIYLLHYFMKQYSNTLGQVSYKESFKYGFLICCFSSIVCACYLFLSLTVLFPESLDAALEQVQAVLATGSYSSQEEEAVMAMMDRLPQITIVSSLIYYIIIGAVMTSIIANFTKKEDPFAGYGNNGGNSTEE